MKKILRGCAVLAVTLMLAACGGGGGDPGTSGFGAGSGSTGTGTGTTTTTVSTPTLALSLSGTTVTSAAPVTATATLTTASGTALAGQVITFSTRNGLGSFSATTALTDASGVASVRLFPAAATSSGADTVVATATINATAVTGSQGFQLSATNVSITGVTSDLPTGSSVSAYGQTNLTVVLGGVTSGTPVSVTLSSTCLTNAKARVNPATVSTTTGTATFTYIDNGCGATQTSDAVTVTASGATSTLSLGLTSPAANSITFASASPQTIYLRGSGLTESSVVSFIVKDSAGNGLPNVAVTLSPSNLTGGLTLDGGSGNVVKRSDSTGTVTAIVNSGTVPTPVRIKASIASGATSISTVSSSLAIAVGLPSQLNFSLSQGTLNIEGGSIDGTANTYTIIASDRLGNPVPDGTAINFISEGGQVQAVGLTTGNPTAGGVTVRFQSSEPRPADGRITVLAYTIGEESFLDLNGNNVYDAGEPFQDLGNVFLSRTYSSTYDPAYDQFVSLSISGSSACASIDPTKDPVGLLTLNVSIPTTGGSTCDGVWGKAYVRRAVETVLSTSSTRLYWGQSYPSGLDSNCAVVNLNDDTYPYPSATKNKYYAAGAGTVYNAAAAGSLSLLVADANAVRLNPAAAGSKVTATATSGLTVTVDGGGTVPSTLSATRALIGYSFSGTTAGVITVTVTSPSGLAVSTPVALSTVVNPGASCNK